jgi:hypothetical protein
MASLESAGWDFEVMVRERLESLASNRMSDARITTLREDNPERALLHDLVISMRGSSLMDTSLDRTFAIYISMLPLP